MMRPLVSRRIRLLRGLAFPRFVLPGLMLPGLMLSGLVLSGLVLLGLSLPLTASAEDVLIELDDCLDPAHGTYGNRSGEPFSRHSCSGATEGYALDGMDGEGEWLEIWSLFFPDGICFVDSLKSAGEWDKTRGYLVEWVLEEQDEVVEADSLQTVEGSGIS
ncbi:MAG: hypothetical protein ACE15D_04105 [Candidatus Eisenbacteria bacterium]